VLLRLSHLASTIWALNDDGNGGSPPSVLQLSNNEEVPGLKIDALAQIGGCGFIEVVVLPDPKPYPDGGHYIKTFRNNFVLLTTS
jgi:hypothetical protein